MVSSVCSIHNFPACAMRLSAPSSDTLAWPKSFSPLNIFQTFLTAFHRHAVLPTGSENCDTCYCPSRGLYQFAQPEWRVIFIDIYRFSMPDRHIREMTTYPRISSAFVMSLWGRYADIPRRLYSVSAVELAAPCFAQERLFVFCGIFLAQQDTGEGIFGFGNVKSSSWAAAGKAGRN